MSEIKINPPINKSYLITFLNNYVQLKFYNDKSISLDSLKNLIFPSDFSELDFKNFIQFIDKIIILVINKNFSDEDLYNTLKNEKEYSFNEDQLYIISNFLNKKKTLIHSQINKKFYSETFDLHHISSKVKTLLSGSNEQNIFQERYCEVEFNLNNGAVDNDNEITHLNLTLFKSDIVKLNKELISIKNNILKIRESKSQIFLNNSN